MLVWGDAVGIMYKASMLPLPDRIRTVAVYRSDAALYHADYDVMSQRRSR